MSCCVALAICLAAPATGAVTPLWIEHATAGGNLWRVVISPDDSTIIIGGDQIISLTRDGQKRWSGWSGTSLDISSQGDYILTAQGPVVRLISAAGTLLWDQSMDSPVTDISMAPDASLIAATTGIRTRTMTLSGDAIALNTTLSVNHLRVMPSGKILITTKNDIQLVDPGLVPAWSDTSSPQDLIAVSGDGSSFVTATNNRIRMYKADGNLSWEKRFSGENAQALACSRDGSTIVVGTDHNNVKVLDQSGVLLFSANATDWISSVAVSNVGNTIVAGSLDKKIYVYNHAGSRLGTFTVKSAIRSGSVAVTGDGMLIVVVDQSDAYGLLRSSFTGQPSPGDTVTGTPGVTPVETATTFLPEPTTRKVTGKPTTLPTPYPRESPTPESPLPPLVPLLALGFLFLCRPGKT